MMPAQIAGFNLAAQMAATNLMDLAAREAFQQQANQLAAQYNQLQSQAKSGSYDTSGLSGLVNGFSNDVKNAQLQQTHPEDGATAGNEPPSAQESPATIVERPVVAVVEVGASKATAPPAPADPLVARPDEQIIPNISAALGHDNTRSGLPSLPAPGSANAAGPGTAALSYDGKAPASGLAVMIAATGDPRPFEAAGAAPESGAGHARKGANEVPGDNAAVSDGAAVPVAAAGADAVAGNGSSPVAGLPGTKSPGPPKEDLRPATLPANLLASVNRVQSGSAEEKKGGWFSELKRTLLGPRWSSFFQPLDLRGGHTPPSLSEDSPDLWWQALAAPFAFTILFSGFVWWRGSRQHRRWLRRVVERPRGKPLAPTGGDAAGTMAAKSKRLV
jgi:hypothetical protein